MGLKFVSSHSLSYRPEVDGLRAFAVIPVILFHFGIDWLAGGYIGVDVFFVISGFLITTILIKEYDNGSFSLKGFWQRRIKRILPVLVIVVIATLVASQFVLYAPDIYHLGFQGIASLLSFANISQWLTAGDYWGFAAENSPLLHTWSLSVEEQFYLFFPILLFVVLKYFRQWLSHLVLLLSIMSFIVFIYGSQNHPDATFYLLPTRAWELGVGAFLAVVLYGDPLFLKDKSKTAQQFLSVLGLISVLASYFLIGGSNGLSGLMIIPVIGTALIIAFSQETHTITHKILTLPAIVYIGKISYSLYLWHWPVIVLAKNLSLKTNTTYPYFGLLCLIVLLSVASYHLIEKPAKEHKKTIPLVLALILIAVFYSYTLTKSNRAEDVSMYNKTLDEGDLYSSKPTHEESELSQRKAIGITSIKNTNKNINAFKEGGITRFYGKEKPEIVVLGDSHAVMWSSTLDKIAKQLNKTISFYAAEGTPTFFDIPVTKSKGTIYFSAEQKRQYDEARFNFLTRWKPEIVIISHNWSNLGGIDETHDLIEFLGEIGSKVYFLEQPPVLFFGDKNAPQFISHYGLKPKKDLNQYVPYINSKWFIKGRKLTREIVDNCDHCELIPITYLYLRNKKGWVLDGYDVLYKDDDHLSSAGTLKAKSRILKAISSKSYHSKWK